MPPSVFGPRRAKNTPLHKLLNRYPALFGVPFVLTMVAASYGLESFTQVRYELHDKKVKQVSQEEALGLSKNRKNFDIREEYYKLSATTDEDWEPKRIQRPPGVPEWGVPPTEPPSKPSSP